MSNFYISKLRGKFFVSVKRKYVGYYKTIEEALAARDKYLTENNITKPKPKPKPKTKKIIDN